MGLPGITPAPAADPGAPREDAVTKLGRAKAMLDHGLISDIEYEALKAKVLADF